jgi:hypothetical protein
MTINWDLVFKILGILGTVIGAVFTGAKFLIKYWHDSQEKIKTLEHEKMVAEFESLKEKLLDSKKSSAFVWQELKTTQTSLAKSREQMIKFEMQIERVISSEKDLVLDLDEMRNLSSTRLKEIENTLVDAQFVKLGENHYMIKHKKKSSM